MLAKNGNLNMKKKSRNNRPVIKRGSTPVSSDPANSRWVQWVKSAPPVKSNNVIGSFKFDLSVVEWSMLVAIASRRGTTVDEVVCDFATKSLGENFDRLQ